MISKELGSFGGRRKFGQSNEMGELGEPIMEKIMVFLEETSSW